MSADAPSDAAATRDADAPSVTALLPAYNAAAFIDETLQSLAAQTYPHFRVLISVDASDDDTAERCERFARGDARFSVVRQARRLGWIRNSCAALRRADTDLCFFMGHDDVVEPEYVDALVAALAGNPRAALAYPDVEASAHDGRCTIVAYPEIDGVAARLERGRIALRRGGAWWATYRGIFRTAAAQRDQPLRRHLSGEFMADWPFLLHFALCGECVRVPRPLYRKRYRTSSLSPSWGYGPLQQVAVGLSCARTLMEADLTIRERMALLGALARRVARNVAQRARLRAG
ncbi:MAG: glycosyltransferase family 2 protein [Phycisphaerales bacterium]|nr:glycosyltransferase family 2 protein [Phycisphaerales bacterium]